MSDLFRDAYRKIERANKHVLDIEYRVAAFCASNAHKLVSDFDSTTGLHKIRFERGENIPYLINLFFGDAVHNLRASLDHAWAQAILALDPSAKIGKLHFPVADMRKGCETALDDREQEHATAITTTAGQRLRETILEVIQPYGAVDNPFRMTSKMDNIDKHRMLLTLFVQEGAYFQRVTSGNLIIEGIEIRNVGSKGAFFGSQDEIKGNMKPTVNVLINETFLPKRMPLVPTLKSVGKVVSEAVEAIDRCITEHKASP